MPPYRSSGPARLCKADTCSVVGRGMEREEGVPKLQGIGLRSLHTAGEVGKKMMDRRLGNRDLGAATHLQLSSSDADLRLQVRFAFTSL